MTTRPVTSVPIQDFVAVWTLDAQGVPSPGNAAARALEILVSGDALARLSAATEELRSGRLPQLQWEESPDVPEQRRFLLSLSPTRERHTVTGFALTATDVTSLRRASAGLFEAGAALNRAPDLTRVMHEAAQQARRLLRIDAIAIRLGGSDEKPLAYLAGYDDEGVVSRRLQGVRGGRASVIGRGEGWFEIGVPLRSGELGLGILAARVRTTGAPGEDAGAIDTLATLGEFLSASLERIDRARSSEHRHRMEAGGDMATAIGNSLRHALYGISSAAQLLRFRTSEDPVLEKNVGRLLREADRVTRLVDALLDFGRPVTLELEAADPDASWDDVLQSHRGQLESRSLAVRRTRGSSGGARPVDARRLNQAFALLLEGAVERAPEATDLELVSEVIAGGAWRSRLTFAGSVEPADLLRFFDPLAIPGSGQPGVSLALSRRIVDAHGGSLMVDSDPERGTTLTVLLPP